MKNKKIKVFLGGYVNFLNAQNINCRALSEYLDKDKFDIWTIFFWYQNASDFEKVPGVHYLRSLRPGRFLGWIPFFLGIIFCDVAYLPKGDYNALTRIVAKLSGCKLFTTLEGVLRGTNISKLSNPQEYIEHFRSFEPNLYSITKYMADAASYDFQLNFNPKVLYLGVKADQFVGESYSRTELKNIVLVGNNLKYKGLCDFLAAAENFPKLTFHVIGGGDMSDEDRAAYLTKHRNLVLHGVCDHAKMSKILAGIDLMFFPSRSEGFPKVMLETACAGVPTLCYSDYGANEWIDSGRNGFVVDTYQQAKDVIQDLIDNSGKLESVSTAAIELGKSFDWKIVIKSWEEEIEKITGKK